jgi:acetate kinase
MVNHESGLLGISETSSDMHTLRSRAKTDVRATEAVAVFCYQAKKWISGMAGALEGLDALVFAGGIGENAPTIRARICRGLEFMGVKLDTGRNNRNASIISSKNSSVLIKVIPTDEEIIIAKAAVKFLRPIPKKKKV